MRLKKYYTCQAITAIFFTCLLACSKMDDTYDDFIKDGEIVYVGRVDSARAYPGNNRMDLSMLLTADPRISKVMGCRRPTGFNGKSSTAHCRCRYGAFLI
jgi:hypothetical protein